jgi:hydrogenase maturation protease
MAGSDGGVLVLGIGNLLWADEGFGVRAVEALQAQWQLPERVAVVDGGTQGYNLLAFVQAARRMIVFDAVDYGLAPGSLKILRDAEVPRYLGACKMSLHQTGFQDVLAVAELVGRLPEELVLIGVQPESIEDYGGGLRPRVAARIAPAVEIALGCLRDWGCTATPRLGPAACLLPAALDAALEPPISNP